MLSNNYTIRYDFNRGKINDIGLVDGAGMHLMRLAAKMTSRMDYVGLSWANRFVRSVFPSQKTVQASLSQDTQFAFPYGDGYWGRLLANAEGYDPETERFLRAIKDTDYCFIDCGANYGYMSALTSSKDYGNRPSIAIEADPDTFGLLQRNAEINANRFEVLNRAIWSKSGEMVNVYGVKHEARSILATDGNTHSGNIETLALDDLVDWVDQQKCSRVILKLDIEGVEIEAMQGLGRLKDKDLLVFFEDHAADPTHEVSRYFLEKLGMQVFYPNPEFCQKITDLKEVQAIKTNPRRGYDFVATNSKSWLETIDAYNKANRH